MILKTLKSDVIRINGKRIDINRLEKEIQLYLGRKKCAVIVKNLSDKQKKVVLFIQSNQTDIIALEDLTVHVKEAEVIDEIIPLSTLPLDDKGKIDKKTLDKLNNIDPTVFKHLQDTHASSKNIVLYTEKFKQGESIHIKDIHLPQPSVSVPLVGAGNNHVAFSKKSAYVYGGPITEVEGDVNTLPDMLLRAAKDHSEQGMFIINQEGEKVFVSYPDLFNKAQRVLGGLRAKGIQAGEKVILLMDSNEWYLYAFWGCVMGGIIPAPMTAPKNFAENNQDIKLLKSVWETMEQPQVISEKDLIENIGRNNKELAFMDIEQLVVSEPEKEIVEVSPEQVAVLLFTSGSTGKPKGVMQTHQNITNKQRAAVQFSAYHADDLFLNWLSIQHVVGLIAFHLMPVYLGATQIHVATDYILEEPLRWMDFMTEYRATITWAPNSLFALMNDSIQGQNTYQWDLSTVKRVINAGESVNYDTCKKFLENFIPYGLDRYAIKPEWGMSETCCMTIASDSLGYGANTGIQILDKNHMEKEIVYAEESSPNKAVFVECGNIYPGLEMRVTDSNHNVLNEGEIGRFQVKGDMVLPGYYNNPEANSASFTEEGWFDTGDLAFIKDGIVTFTGRVKDVIIVNGVNYQNVDIETCVEELDDVDVTFTAACAVRLDGDSTDSVAVFYVSLLEDQEQIKKQIDTIKSHVFATIGLKIRYVLPVTRKDIPKTNIGKIQRSQLVQKFQNGVFNELVKEQDSESSGDDLIHPCFFRPEWVKSRLETDGNLNGKNILLYSQDHEAALEMQEAFIHKGAAACRVVTNLDECIDHLKSFSVDDLVNLVHFHADDQIRSEQDYIQEANTCISETNIILREIASAHPVRYYVVVKNSEEDYSYSGLLEGYLKSLNQEEEKFQMMLMGVDSESATELARVLRGEMLYNDEEEMVLYREDDRYIQSLKAIDVKQEMQETTKLKVSGRYIITGGTGGIGQWVSRELSEKFAAELILVGKTPLEKLDSKRKDYLQGITQLNPNVCYVDANITTEEGLEKLKKTIDEKWNGEVDGIFHLAGVGTFSSDYDSSEHYCRKEEDYDSFFAPKVNGTIQLSKLLNKDTLFVVFGSVNGYFGGAGFSAYSAANSFLSSYTNELKKRGYHHCYCLNWSAWNDIGMSRDSVFVNLIAEKGFIPLTVIQALYSMFAVLQTNESNLYIGLDGFNRHISHKIYHKDELELQSTLFLEKGSEEVVDELEDLQVFDSIILLDSIPLDERNRVDVNKLRLLIKQQHEKDLIELETETEKALANIWEEILDVDKIGKNSDFFHLGGHSLNATKLVALIKSRLQVKIPLNEVFKHSSLSKLAEKIDHEFTKGKVQPLTIKHEIKESYELSYAQKRVYLLETIEKQRGLYNIVGAWDMHGKVDLAVMKEAVQILVKRHPMLRTTFKEVDGVPKMMVQDDMNIPFVVLDLEGLPDAMKNNKIDEMIQNECDREYDFVNGPLMYCTVAKKDKDDLVFIISQHHIISDGWSLGVLVMELGEIYNSLLNGEEWKLPEFRVEITDYIEFKNKSLLENHSDKKYWLDKLDSEIEALDLPIDFERPALQTYRGDTVMFEMSGDLNARLETFNVSNGSTMFMTLLSAYYLLLHKLTLQEDLVIGIPVAGREDVEVKDFIGMFVNSLAVRNQINHEMSLTDFIQQIRSSILESFEHQDYPFDKLVDDLNPPRSLNRTPLFQTMFNYLSVPLNFNMEQANVEEHMVRHRISKYDISIHILELAEKLSISFEYNVDLFEEDSIHRWLGHYVHVVNQILENPDQTIAELEILSDEDKAAILAINDHKTNYPKDKSIPELFKEVRKVYENKIAVVFDRQKLTYQQLDERSDELASELIRKGVKVGEIVGIYAERTIETIIGILAILKIGATYLPINKKFAANVISHMLEDCEVKLILTSGEIESYEPIQCVDLLQRYEKGTYDLMKGGDPLAYVIYTSGTTGVPKGVKVRHRNIVRLVKDASWIDLSDRDVILQTGALSFDASTFEIWGALLNGMTLCLVEDDVILDTQKLKDEISKHHVSIMWVSAPLFNQLVDSDEAVFTGCKKLLVGGDVLSITHINKVMEACPDITVMNGYGPTENTTFSTTYPIKRKFEKAIPIGYPISNSTAYVLDKSNHLQPIGVVGELCVGGDGVADGYLNREDLTAERFVDDPFNPGKKMYRTGDFVKMDKDGILHFIGRMDNQVKVRGFRVELDAIKAVLLKHKDITDVVVLVQEMDGTKAIMAYVVQNGDHSESNLNEYLKKQLPFYMIPSRLIFVNAIPLNTNGKVDVKRLKLMKSNTTSMSKESTIPLNDLEKTLLDLYTAILNNPDIGLTDSFFEMGGDSLLTIKLTARLKDVGYKVDPKLVFMYPSIRELAKEIMQLSEPEHLERTPRDYLIKMHDGHKEQSNIFFAPPAGGTILGYIELSRHFKATGTTYGIQAPGLYEDEPLKYLSFDEMVDFFLQAIEGTYRPGVDYLAGHSLGGHFAFTMCVELMKKGKAPKGLIILDTTPSLDLISTDAQQDINEEDFKLFVLTMGIGNMMNVDTKRFENMSYEEVKNEIIEISKTDEMVASFLNEQYLDKYLKMQLHHILMSREVVLPKVKIDVPIHVIRTTEHEQQVYQLFEQWKDYAGRDLKIIDMDANHTSMMKLPHVQDLAEKIEKSCFSLVNA